MCPQEVECLALTLANDIRESISASLARWTARAVARVRQVTLEGPSSPVAVLMYHGVVEKPLSVPDWCFIDARAFEAQIRYLTRHFDIVHLDTAMTSSTPYRRPRVCLTFDDGFANVATVAAPILRRYSAPAAVFLVTGLVDTSDTVWFARLHDALIKTSATTLRFGDTNIALRSTHERAKASARLQAIVKMAPAADVGSLVAEIIERLGLDPRAPIPADSPFRILDSATIRELVAEDLLRFGGHTTSHTILTRLPLAQASRDLADCQLALEAITGRKSVLFAYPNGRASDFDDSIITVLRSLGVEFALTTEAGPWLVGDDPLRIRRYGVGYGDRLFTLARQAHHLTWLTRIRPG